MKPTDIDIAVKTDVGKRRENNEDSNGIFHREEPGGGTLLVVADGMGGAAGGEVASSLAVESIRDSFLKTDDSAIEEWIQAAVEDANQTIFDRAKSEPALHGMGTTCTAALLSSGKLIIGHVGDSSAYISQDDSIHKVTHDHTLAAEAERMPEYEALLHRFPRHLLTRSVGVGETLQVDVEDATGAWVSGATLIICSDGLSNEVAESEMGAVVTQSRNAQEVCDKLIDLALTREAADNVTVLVARRLPS